jgi:hypothetical protein
VYPLGSHFRQLLLLHGDAWHVHTIDAAVANVSPGIDSLHLTGPLGANSTPDVPLLTYDATRQHDAYRPLWLKWGRFDQDALRVVTKNSALGYFSIAIAFAECPAEVPL